MKKSLRHLFYGSAAALLTSGSLQAAPFISIADTVDVFFLGSASVDYRTNLFNAPDKRDDFVFKFSPGLEARVGRNTDATVSVIFREDILRYNRYSGQNTNLANVILRGTYNSGPLKTDLGFSFRQTQSNTPDTYLPGASPDLFVERDLYNAHLNFKYDVMPKYWVKGGFQWRRTEYTNNPSFGNNFSNSDVYTVPVDVFYRYSEKLSVGLGYRYRHTDTARSGLTPGRNYNDHFFSVALDGEILPKLSAVANIGYQLRDVSGSSNGQFAIDAELTYELTPKVELFAGGSHDFGVSSTGGGKELLSGHVGANYQINSFFSATGRFEQLHTKYRNVTRRDDTSYLNLSLNYSPNIYWTFSAGYGYVNNSSNINAASFSGNTISLSASLRY